MRESVLRDYFLGFVDEESLRGEIAGSAVRTSHNRTSHFITDDFSGDFEVNATHFVRLCDAFLTGNLQADHLEFIGFALEASDYFIWNSDNEGSEDSPLAKTIHAWGSPEINYPLTRETIEQFKYLLQTGENPFTEAGI